MYEFEILRKVDKTKWNNQLLNCKYSTFFQTAEFLTEDTSNKYPLFIYVYDENGDVKGQLGITIVKIKSGNTTFTLKKIVETASKLGNRGTWVSGPIIHTTDHESRIKTLKTIVESLQVVTKENNLMLLGGYSPPQDFLINESYISEFTKDGYNTEKFVTLATDLDVSVDELWKKIKKSARNDVTKAQRENIEIKEVQTKEKLKEFKLLDEKWARTKGIYLEDPLLNFNKDWRDLNAGIQKFFVASINDEILSGLRVGCFNGIAYTHQVLNTYSKIGNVGGPLLTWHALKWAKQSGMRIYDFSGGNAMPENTHNLQSYQEQWNSLFAYKRKWGGSEYPYFHCVKIINKKKYKIFRILQKPDWILREHKRKKFKKSKTN